MMGQKSHTPEWAETEYGNQLRNGSFLVLVQGDRALVARAQLAMTHTPAISIRIREAQD
jgi:hypothetical protein